ncbi:hypothetical protein QBC41DRAFT_346584 [Cercophora samala]|uniref:Uncharacterized protein n=1 Tax=Cercophora samala TaxID=330535 RepID=A0AA39ZE97_9PEZI|nr:hypothetical protein QBC41DRAFT_346584 [Cercophora samala]
MGRLSGLLLALFSPLSVLGSSPKTVGACGSSGLSLFANVGYEGPCQPFSFAALDNTDKASCVNVNSSLPVYSIYKGSALACCFLYEQPCPDQNSPFYPQRPYLTSQRLFVPGIFDLSRFGWEGNTIKSIVCPDKATCESLKYDEPVSIQDVWVERTVENPYTGKKFKKKAKEQREISLRGYWLDLQNVEGHERAI